VATKFCTSVSDTEIVSCYRFDAWDFEEAVRFLENTCTPGLINVSQGGGDMSPNDALDVQVFSCLRVFLRYVICILIHATLPAHIILLHSVTVPTPGTIYSL
jgi:hypothetical protein